MSVFDAKSRYVKYATLATATDRRQAVLLEMNVSGEASKTGFRAQQREEWAQLRSELKHLTNHPGLNVPP